LQTLLNPAAGVAATSAWGDQIRENQQTITPRGAWTAYTPTVAQGTATDITKTVNLAKWMRVGRLIKVRLILALSGAGGSSTTLTVSLPVDCATHTAGSQYEPIGQGVIVDTSGPTQYPVIVLLLPSSSVSTCRFVRTDSTVNNYFGIDPALTVASGDIIHAGFEYEAAAD
jgi:hypothetical protein